ncbi:MAG: phenylalanine--tRNA ligase subunit alpha [Acidobacteria bacterium]|nr:MAG: phenylalanine--tRNA ligase subunit alpha [Acidobacteriota bacterium]
MSSNDGTGRLRAIEQKFNSELASVHDARSLEDIRTRYLSRKSGLLTTQLQNLGELPKDQRAEFGRVANQLKSKIEAALDTLQTTIFEREKQSALERETLDVTLPGNRRRIGHRHPLTIVWKEIEDIFISMGYTVEDGPEIESTYYNFDALNFPVGHPARDPRDTFYVGENMILRTHTSPVQVRTMEKVQPPVRIICPGRVFRRDAFDPTHSPMFHQVECLVVDEGITFSDLKGTLERFHKQFFGEKTKTRLRPSFFPFVEPGAEVDISCVFCDGSGCRVCKGTGWIEVMGAGMVHPNLYGFVNYDAEKYTGFAFGGGIDRYAMLKYNINDLQLFFQNEMRFLQQF